MSDLSQERLERVLEGSPLGLPVRYFDSIGSTNDVAREWARAGITHGALGVANTQTEGRGRMGRDWEGGEGKSILATFILPPEHPPKHIPFVSGAAAVAVVRAISGETGLYAQSKWPNDVWIGRKKVAGILLEAEWRDRCLLWVLLGIGINVNQREEDLPPNPRTPATSLALETGREWDRTLLLRRLAEELAVTVDLTTSHPRRLMDAWEDAELTMYREVEVVGEGRTLRGTVRGLLPDGSLRLESGDFERRLAWGEVSVKFDPDGPPDTLETPVGDR